MKVADLLGVTLDYWVAKAWMDGVSYVTVDTSYVRDFDFHPSENWAQGGPIIERERIELLHYGQDGINLAGNPWEAQIGCDAHYIDQGPGDAMGGPTPLVAAMRAYVASRLGDEVPDSAIDAPPLKAGNLEG